MTDQSTPPPLATPVMVPGTNDVGHLRLLVIFHYIFAGFGCLGFVFLGGHFAVMRWVMTNPEFHKNQQPGGPPPEMFMTIFSVMYVVMGVILLAGIVANVLSARFIARRRNRLFSLIVAGVDCAQFPFGTALGVCTFIVLLRDSVRRLYQEAGGR
jgi:hypothetical protein